MIEFALDQHLTIPAEPAAVTGLAALSEVNQAIGVLIARGRTVEQAERELDAGAANARIARRTLAQQILAAQTSSRRTLAEQNPE